MDTLHSFMTADQLWALSHTTFSRARYADADRLGIDLAALAAVQAEGEVSRYTVYQPAGFARFTIVTADGERFDAEISLGQYDPDDDTAEDYDAGEFAQSMATMDWEQRGADRTLGCQSVYLTPVE